MDCFVCPYLFRVRRYILLAMFRAAVASHDVEISLSRSECLTCVVATFSDFQWLLVELNINLMNG